MICGKDETKRVGQFHYIKFQPNWKQTLLIYCQRCMHLLDVMTSKIFSKNVALKKAETDVVENLVAFGKTPISAHINASETFLVKCIHRKASCESFDELKMDWECNTIIEKTNSTLERYHLLLRVFTSINKKRFSTATFGIIHTFVKFRFSIH